MDVIRQLGPDDADLRRLPRAPGHRRGVRRRRWSARRRRCTARRRPSSTTAAACSAGSPLRSMRRAITRWSSPRTISPAELEVTARTDGRRHDHGAAASTLPVTVSSSTRNRFSPSEGRRILRNFLEGRLDSMFPALIEKLIRREDLTSDEAAAAMAEIMEGRAAEPRSPASWSAWR